MRSDKNIIIIFSIKISQQLVSCRDRLNVGHLYIYMLCSRASTQQLYIIVAYINRTSSKLNPLSKKKKKKSSRVESCADEIPGVAWLHGLRTERRTPVPSRPTLLCYDFWAVGFGDLFVCWWCRSWSDDFVKKKKKKTQIWSEYTTRCV